MILNHFKNWSQIFCCFLDFFFRWFFVKTLKRLSNIWVLISFFRQKFLDKRSNFLFDVCILFFNTLNLIFFKSNTCSVWWDFSNHCQIYSCGEGFQRGRINTSKYLFSINILLNTCSKSINWDKPQSCSCIKSNRNSSIFPLYHFRIPSNTYSCKRLSLHSCSCTQRKRKSFQYLI